MLLGFVAIACLAPFARKAIHVDDPVYLWVAQQVQSHPLDFFGFQTHWHVARTAMHRVNKNPPLVSYCWALVAGLAGWSEGALHAGGIGIALLAAGGVYGLARRLCAAPLAAAGIALATPGFAVSATTLLSDVLMLALWCWALPLWRYGIDRGRTWALAGAGFLVCLSALAKYFGLALIPLILAHSILRERRVRARLAWLLLPVAALLGYEAYTRTLYGHGLLSEVFRYATAVRGGASLPDRLLVGLSFTGGCIATVPLLAPMLWRRRTLLAACAGGVAVALVLLEVGGAGGFAMATAMGVRWDLVIQIAVFALAGASVLGLALAELLRDRGSADSALLAFWVFGTFAFASFFNWTVSARAILPMVPAVGILASRRLEARLGGGASRVGRYAAGPISLGLALGLAVAWGDQQWAASSRNAAREIGAELSSRGGRIFFQGHWGFQYYLEALGGRPYDWYRDRLEPGDWMVLPGNNSNVGGMPAGAVEGLGVRRFPSSRWITLMSVERGAGFYSSAFGPLPFAFGAAPEERYDVLRVVAPVEPRRLR